MGITAMALALMVLGLVAGCLQWSLLFHFEEFYPVADDGSSHGQTARLLVYTLTGLATLAILAVLLLESQQLVSS